MTNDPIERMYQEAFAPENETTETLTVGQYMALLNCAKLLKDFANAADGDSPYTAGEMLAECWLALDNIRREGIVLYGEDED